MLVRNYRTLQVSVCVVHFWAMWQHFDIEKLVFIASKFTTQNNLAEVYGAARLDFAYFHLAVCTDVHFCFVFLINSVRLRFNKLFVYGPSRR